MSNHDDREKEEICADIIWTVRCLTLAVDKKMRNEKLWKNYKKLTTTLRSKYDIYVKSHHCYSPI